MQNKNSPFCVSRSRPLGELVFYLSMYLSIFLKLCVYVCVHIRVFSYVCVACVWYFFKNLVENMF